MKTKLRLLWCVLALFGATMASCTHEASERSRTSDVIDQKVDSLLRLMTLEEKVGQMTQLTLDMICVGEPYQVEEPHRIEESKLVKVIETLKVGSILNNAGHGYDRETWLNFIGRIQETAMKNTCQIPVLYGIDAIHGVNYTNNATLFPQQISLAATWDTALVKSLAELSAYETRASGIRWNFSPVLDIARDPRWPRFWESFGEDVKLVSDMGQVMVEGYQGELSELGCIDSLHVSACLKHFVGYSQTLSGKDRTQAWIPERQLREYFLPSFHRAIDAGAKTIMVNSGEINGIPVHVNPAILTNILRNEFGFKGMVVTDWEDIRYLVTRHHVAASYKEAIKMAIDAGIDMSMVPVDLEFPVLLKELVDEGAITESRIDQSVRRILRLKFELGLFDSATPEVGMYPEFASEQHRALALKAAQESLVLLKNNNSVLPRKRTDHLIIIGENARSLNALNGGWTHTWQGVDTTLNTPDMPTILEAFKDRFDRVTYLTEEAYLQGGMASQQANEMVIAVLGETPYTETPGDLEDLTLPHGQLEVINKVAQETGATALVLVEGRPRTMGELPEGIDAFILAMLPGDQGGRALADVFTGSVNPSGHLPFTYPKHPSSHATYDHKYTDRIDTDFSLNAFDPLYRFGDGLSYTTFEYNELNMTHAPSSITDTLRIDVLVSNNGDLDGADVVQVYVSDSVASITPSVKRLRAWRRVELASGETERINFEIPMSELSFVGVDQNWVVEPGMFSVSIGDLTESFLIK